MPLAMVTLYAWGMLRHSHQGLLPRLSAASIAGIRKLVSPSLMFGLITVSVTLTLQGPVLLVSRSLGGTAVALLVTTRTLGNVARQGIGALNVALWPEMTRLYAIGATESLRLIHRLLVIGSTMLCAAFAGTLWFEGREVFEIWTGGKLIADIWLLRLFVLALVLQTPWLASSLFTAASNRHRNLSYSYAGSAVLTLVAIAVLIRPWGLLAVPAGILFGDAVACYHFVIKDTCRVLKEDYPRYAVRLWAGVAAMSLAAWGAAWLGHSIAIGPPPLRWLQVGGVATVAAVACAWGFALQKEDRSHLVRWGRSRWSARELASAESPL
jgi:O-antigen/teichoic acid export membrane protein